MPDITDLLELGAGRVDGPVDVSAVATRARVLHRQRLALRTSLGAAVAAVLVVGGLQLAPAASVDGLQPEVVTPAGTADRDTRPTPSSASTQPALASAPPRRTTDSEPGPATAGGARPVVPPAVGPATPAATPTRTTNPDGAFPPARGCRVTTEGAAPDETRTCRFTATAVGGYRATQRGGLGTEFATHSVTVHRGSQTWTYSKSCGDVVIEPGDRVTVSVTAADASAGVQFLEVEAGSGVGC